MNFLLSKLQITIFHHENSTFVQIPTFLSILTSVFTFFPNRNSWILNLLSYLFKKKAEIEFYVESDIKRNQFFKKRLPSIFGHSMMMMRVLMLMLVSSVMYDGAKELESAPKNTKRMKKWHLLVPSCFKDAELKKFLTFARKKVWFYVMWRA